MTLPPQSAASGAEGYPPQQYLAYPTAGAVPEPLHQNPAYQNPGYQNPGYQDPLYQSPGYAGPGYAVAAYQDPTLGGAYPAYAYAPPASTAKTLSIWGLILGISSIVLPFGLNAIAGGVLSAIGLSKEPLGKGMAIAGIVTSGVGFVWTLVFWPVVFPLFLLFGLSAWFAV